MEVELKPSAHIINYDERIAPNLPSVTIKIDMPIYIWNFIDEYGYTIEEDSPYEKLLTGVVLTSQLSPNSAGMISHNINQELKSLVSFYGKYEKIPIETMMSLIPFGWMRTKIKKFSRQDLFLIYNSNKNSIFEEWDCLLKEIEALPFFNELPGGHNEYR